MTGDLLKQAYEAMMFNRRRTAITTVGMAWGIATVVLLLAYGAGFGRAINAIFSQFGVNAVGAFPGVTSEQAGGTKAGVKVRLTVDDLDRLWNDVPGVERMSPQMVAENIPVQNDLHSYNWEVNAGLPPIAEIMRLEPEQGRFFTTLDNEQRAHVAVLGSEAKTKLFSGMYAVGQRIRLKGVAFTVIGVLAPKMQEGDSNINRQVWIPFTTMSDLKDLKYIDGLWLSYRGDHTRVVHALRQSLAAAHAFRPSDKNALFVADVMEQVSQFHIIQAALQVLMAFIGALTLGIAGIGLMNIMLVSVQQRTREIGVEKALGAQKRHILTQFLAEALVITAVGGMAGMALAYTVSLVVGRITFYSAVATHAESADIQLLISPLIVAVATGILVVVGLVSGMLPAIKAANLDPIEALRYE